MTPNTVAQAKETVYILFSNVPNASFSIIVGLLVTYMLFSSNRPCDSELSFNVLLSLNERSVPYHLQPSSMLKCLINIESSLKTQLSQHFHVNTSPIPFQSINPLYRGHLLVVVHVVWNVITCDSLGFSIKLGTFQEYTVTFISVISVATTVADGFWVSNVSV